jgi:Ras-related protein Rab-8A
MNTTASTKTGSQGKEQLIKLLLIGDTGVGKSCLLLRFSDDSFTLNFMPTIGIDFKLRTMKIGAKNYRLQVWDTAGQERFRTITSAYYRGAHGVALVYDVTDAKSFNNIKSWMRNIEQHASSSIIKILIANKSDMGKKRVIETAKGQALADKYGIRFFETSAKTGAGVEEAFGALATEVKERVLDARGDDSLTTSSSDDERRDHSGRISLDAAPSKKDSNNNNNGMAGKPWQNCCS